MASGLKKQDGKKIACVVLVATKKGEKEQDHTAEAMSSQGSSSRSLAGSQDQ